MDHINKNEDPVLEILKERAKELNCLYQVESSEQPATVNAGDL